MTIQQMKDAIADVYDTKSWRRKVEYMYDDQVIAIYHNFLERGILGKVMRRERPVTVMNRESSATDVCEVKEECEQLSFFD